ncbi:MAG: ATP-dependent DNA ligase [Propionicimonas sp.]
MAAPSGQQVTVDGRVLALTNLDKVLYPATGTTKGEVIAYYAEVGAVLLPHVRQRPMTRKRWPDGVGLDGDHVNVFFAKNLPKGTPDWVRRYTIQHSDGTNDYPVADELATLVWLAQLAALELHVPQWRFSEEGTPLPPDRLVLDLDPGEGVTLADCAEVAGWVREVLDGAGLTAFPVTSGSKGIHLYTHLDGTLTTAQASDLARELAQALQTEHPDRVTAVMRKSNRSGKVFLDWSQNNGNKTTITPYSLRGRTRPTVAAPRTWEELADPNLRQVELGEMAARLSELGDLLAPLAATLERNGDGSLSSPPPNPETPDKPAPSLDRNGNRPHSSPGTSVADAAESPDKLAKYRSMRDPRKTPEPVPAAAPVPSSGNSFVIQEHHARRLHYDFRLEHEGVLVSWAVPKGPPTDPKTNHLAVPTEDHPLDYGSFEGSIPAGEYGGGSVRIWDAGSYELEKWRDGKEVIATLHGRPDGGLGGAPAKFALIHTGKDWLIHRMVIEPDQPQVEPVETRIIEPGDPIEPMLATLSSQAEITNPEDWHFEMKWDGVRIIAYLEDGQVRLLSRRGRDETARYPDLVPDLVALNCRQAVLDGEIVVLDAGGAPNFGLLQPRINLTRASDIASAARLAPAQLFLFDVLRINGDALLRRPYEERRELLEGLQPPPGSRVQVPPVFEGDLESAMDTSRALRLEGVVAKRRGSVYLAGGRGRTWLKIKHHLEQSVVIGGWRPGNGNRDGTIGSLLLGIPDDDGLRYVGRVGSGFSDAGLAEAKRLLGALAKEEPSLVDVPAEDARDAHWVEPTLVGEVSYTELTSTHRLRHPVWKGWRPDVLPGGVTWELPK